MRAKLNLSYREWSEAVDAGTLTQHRERERAMTAILDQIWQEQAPKMQRAMDHFSVYGRVAYFTFADPNDPRNFEPIREDFT